MDLERQSRRMASASLSLLDLTLISLQTALVEDTTDLIEAHEPDLSCSFCTGDNPGLNTTARPPPQKQNISL